MFLLIKVEKKQPELKTELKSAATDTETWKSSGANAFSISFKVRLHFYLMLVGKCHGGTEYVLFFYYV